MFDISSNFKENVENHHKNTFADEAFADEVFVGSDMMGELNTQFGDIIRNTPTYNIEE